MVREADVAYHAGNREWNERSIGIEHEGYVDDPDRWFTDTAYRASAQLAADISTRYDIPIDREHIVGHHEVPGATHTDPGPYWDWDRYLDLVRAAAK
jgi:N-acetyl-anhydromuramyl-L-alanine amidase AmpD